MKKKILLTLVCLLLITGCKDVKLKNGENSVVTFKEGGISSDELYEELKNTYGAEKIMDLIDMSLLEPLYKTTTAENDYISQSVKSVKDSAKSMGATFELYINYYYGIKTEKDFKNYLSLNYKRDLWSKDYGKELVTDKQINDYYETETIGDIDASHILLTVNVKDDATDEEKKSAENKVLEKAKTIISELKDGKDFSTLAKQYSEDSTTSKNGGALGKVNHGDVEDEVISALRNMKDGSYSTSAVKAADGYHILYKTSQDEKPELDDTVKEEIRTTIGEEISSETGFSIKALKALREKNEMKFQDTNLQKDFEDLISQYETQNTQTSN